MAAEPIVAQLTDVEAGILNQSVDRPVEIAASGDAPLEAVEAVLPPRRGQLGTEPVLEEVEPLSRSQHAKQLVQGLCGVGDGAQCERAERGVDGGIAERQMLSVEAHELDGNR